MTLCVRLLAIITIIAILTSCSQQQPYRASAPRPLYPVGRPISRGFSPDREQRLEDRGRLAWESAVSLEKLQRHSEALKGYLEAVSLFDQALAAADSDRIPLANRPPSVYLNAARCHIDIGRLVAGTERNQEKVAEHLSSAERILRQVETVHSVKADRQGDFWQPWAWRIYYLLGDVHFLQHRLAEARHDYLIASILNRNLPEAKAMSAYIAEVEGIPAAPILRPSRQGTTSRRLPQPPPPQAAPDLESIKIANERARAELERAQRERTEAETQIRIAQAEADAARAQAEAEEARAAEMRAKAAQARAEAEEIARRQTAQSAALSQAEADRLARLKHEIPPGRLLSYGAAALPAVARLLGFAEFGPWGIAVGVLSFAGMAWEDWNKMNAP